MPTEKQAVMEILMDELNETAVAFSQARAMIEISNEVEDYIQLGRYHQSWSRNFSGFQTKRSRRVCRGNNGIDIYQLVNWRGETMEFCRQAKVSTEGGL